MADYKEISTDRADAMAPNKNGLDTKFEAFTITAPGSSKITQDMQALKWLKGYILNLQII